MPMTIDELQEKGLLEDVVKSKMVQKYLAYRDLAEGIEALKEDDAMYDQLIQGIEDKYSRVSDQTIRDVLDAFVSEVESNTAALESADEDVDMTDQPGDPNVQGHTAGDVEGKQDE